MVVITQGKNTVAQLRKEAQRLGIANRSRMSKAELLASLSPMTVYRQDKKAMAWLRRTVGKEPWLQFEVAEWESRGSGKYRRSWPRAWFIPAGLLGETVPIGQVAANAIRAERSEKSTQAYKLSKDKRQRLRLEIAGRIGSLSNSKAVDWVISGHISEDEAKSISRQTRFRHEHTNYDELLGSGHDRETARALATLTSEIPDNWEAYLGEYGFEDDPVAEALADVLADPQQAHPRWFAEAVNAVKWANLPLDNLTYQRIRGVISDKRAACRYDFLDYRARDSVH